MKYSHSWPSTLLNYPDWFLSPWICSLLAEIILGRFFYGRFWWPHKIMFLGQKSQATTQLDHIFLSIFQKISSKNVFKQVERCSEVLMKVHLLYFLQSRWFNTKIKFVAFGDILRFSMYCQKYGLINLTVNCCIQGDLGYKLISNFLA